MQVYSRRTNPKLVPTEDDSRMRVRLALRLKDFIDDKADLFGKVVELELGIQIYEHGMYGATYIPWNTALTHLGIADVLDIVDLASRLKPEALHPSNGQTRQLKFRKDVERIFREQAVAYRLDEDGLVQPFVDDAFTSSLRHAHQELINLGLIAASESLVLAERSLLATHFDGRAAVRHAFDALENVFKVRFPGTTHLNDAELKNRLLPLIEERGDVSKLEKRASSKLFNVLKSVVEAGHFYRHATDDEQPTPPSSDFAVSYVALAAASLRWLERLSSTGIGDE